MICMNIRYLKKVWFINWKTSSDLFYVNKFRSWMTVFGQSLDLKELEIFSMICCMKLLSPQIACGRRKYLQLHFMEPRTPVILRMTQEQVTQEPFNGVKQLRSTYHWHYGTLQRWLVTKINHNYIVFLGFNLTASS